VNTDRWFVDWFNDDYLKVYAHRDDREARSIVDLICETLPASSGGRTLDLGCGAGRHLPYLQDRQAVVGLDLSPWLIDAARRSHPEAPLVRADMRAIPFRDDSFTLVVSLFTSFGYFGEDAENRRVLEDIGRITSPGGWLVLDFLNAPFTRRTVVDLERAPAGSGCADQSRSISESGRFVLKTIRLPAKNRSFHERVRLFEPQDLIAMIAASGFAVRCIFGDYEGRALTPHAPRAVIFAQRAPTARAGIATAGMKQKQPSCAG